MEADDEECEGFSEIVPNRNFVKMEKSQQFKHLTQFFSTELLKTFQCVVNERISQLGKRNLPFWKFNQRFVTVDFLSS